MKTTPNQDLASLTVPSISPSCRRRSVPRRDISTSTGSGEYQRNGRKRRCVPIPKFHTDFRRIQRRLSRGSALPEMLLDSPMDSTSPNSRSCTDIQAMTYQKDIQGPPLMAASSGPTTLPTVRDERPDPEFLHVFSHILRGYDPEAPHFDGLSGARSKDFSD
jgi:hypothetical protein